MRVVIITNWVYKFFIFGTSGVVGVFTVSPYNKVEDNADARGVFWVSLTYLPVCMFFAIGGHDGPSPKLVTIEL